MKNKKVCIIGLGYVGLPLAELCSQKGYETYGFDTDKKKVELINKGINYIDSSKLVLGIKATTDEKIMKKCNIIIICVPTPVHSNHMPDLNFVELAADSVQRNLTRGKLIILESTVNPGVTDDLVKPILEKSGLKAGRDFYLANCPERIDPGNKKWNVRNIPRVLGASSNQGEKLAYEFYKSVLDADVTIMSSIKCAEAVKIMENAFRDINIAFVNELAMSFDKMGIDITEVIRGASTKPFAFMPHYPGCGVGGHCIPVDPYYLIEKAASIGFQHKFLKLAREINNKMPFYTVSLLEKGLGALKGKKIGVLGIAYKRNVSDMRESPALKIIEILKEKNAEVFIFDPFIPKKSNTKSIKELMGKSDYIILATDHDVFRQIKPSEFSKNKIKIIIDGKNCLDMDKIKKQGILYRGIGRA